MRKFKASIDQELDEMRRCKADMQQLKDEITNQYGVGYYQRDKQRIVISAPEIVIGNVLKDGSLIPNESSKVIIRSNSIIQEGVGNAYGRGSIVNKAPQIKNVCVDVGVDGLEAVVREDSQFTVQAQGIALQSENTNGTFVDIPCASKGEICLKADEHVTVAALAPLKYRKSQIEAEIKIQESAKDTYEEAANLGLDSIKTCTDELSALFKRCSEYFHATTNMVQAPVFANLVNIEDAHKSIKAKQATLCQLTKEFQENTSKAAEASRQLKTLKAQKAAIEETQRKVDNNECTNAAIDICAENTNIHSVNADNTMCTSEGAGVSISGKNIELSAISARTGLIKNSKLSVNTAHINLSTANTKDVEGKSTKLAEGDVKITSREIYLESVDKEYNAAQGAAAEDLYVEKELTKSGIISLRAKNVEVKSQNVQGEPDGEFNVNSKIVRMGAQVQDKQSKKLVPAQDSLFTVNYSGTFIAATEWLGLLATKNVLVSSEENIGILQGVNKAVIQLNDGKATMKGQEIDIMGKTIVNGIATFKADAQFASASIDGLHVKGGYQGPHSLEGSTVEAAPANDPKFEPNVKSSDLEENINKINETSEKEKEEERKEVEKQKEEEQKEIKPGT